MRQTFLITLLLLLFATACQSQLPEPASDGDPILAFLAAHPDKSSMQLVRNDTVLADFHADRTMPLASTVKIIIAIEYAEQAAAGTINPDELIPLDELDRFYVANTDGGAHPAWLNAVSDQVKDNRVAVREIARGMINFSSNANTEWLSQRLGLEKINAQLERLEAKDHTPIYYLVSSLFVGKERFPGITGPALEEELRNLTTAAYIQTTNEVHQKLLNDQEYKDDLGDLSMNIQRVWSDRLPAATTADYVAVLKKINSRTFFNESAQRYLDEVLEGILANPANRQWLAHAGMKGGSTAFVLTKALYATDKDDNQTELAYFFNNLEPEENVSLQTSMNEFELKILTNPAFRDSIQRVLPN